jgi:hypothetical protein
MFPLLMWQVDRVYLKTPAEAFVVDESSETAIRCATLALEIFKLIIEMSNIWKPQVLIWKGHVLPRQPLLLSSNPAQWPNVEGGLV